MINFIVLGRNKHVLVPVLQSIRSFTDAKAITIGGEETRSLKWSTLCEQHLTINFDGSGDDAFVALINNIVEKIQYVTLIPTDCDAVRLTNRVRERLSLNIAPIPMTATLDMFDDKWRFYQFCKQNQIPVPQTRLYGSKNELDFSALSQELGLPFVVKPVNEAGARGVQIIHDQAQFERLVRGNDSYDYAPLIAQSYIEGSDIDISLLADRGQIGSFAIQQAKDFSVQFVHNSELEQMAVKLCKLSAYHGVMHIDARIDKRTGKVYLLESNPRFWASLNASVACGLNFVAESIQALPRKHGIRRLTAGKSYTSFPALNPSTWPALLSDAGDSGRLLRAMTFDPYAIGSFATALPSIAWRQFSRQASDKLRVTKKLNGFLHSGIEQKRLTKN
ncbi:MAG: ATP-grasp domain-containing protein [Burkholderiaceae bacterium]